MNSACCPPEPGPLPPVSSFSAVEILFVPLEMRLLWGSGGLSRAELSRANSQFVLKTFKGGTDRNNEKMKLILWIVVILLRSLEETCGNGEC